MSPTPLDLARFWSKVGPIPGVRQLDHLCRNRCCCNPAHLEPVDSRANTMRGLSHVAARARQTHCIHGHEFTVQNTYIAPSGARMCRPCKRARERAARKAKTR